MSNREALVRPLDAADIEYRPGSATWDHKPACEGPKCRETKDPKKHIQLAYVGDETVMDRLDEGFGPGYWQVATEAIADGVVRVRLGVCYDLENWVWFEDFGYASRHDGDQLKEAGTDGIRRCGRFVIPAVRALYRKDATTPGRPAAPPARPASPPRPVTSSPAGEATPVEPAYLRDAPPPFAAATVQAHDEAATRDGFCPNHGIAWVLRPGGVSKATGKAYDAFWACPSDARPYCKAKPSAKWVAMHEVAS